MVPIYRYTYIGAQCLAVCLACTHPQHLLTHFVRSFSLSHTYIHTCRHTRTRFIIRTYTRSIAHVASSLVLLTFDSHPSVVHGLRWKSVKTTINAEKKNVGAHACKQIVFSEQNGKGKRRVTEGVKKQETHPSVCIENRETTAQPVEIFVSPRTLVFNNLSNHRRSTVFRYTMITFWSEKFTISIRIFSLARVLYLSLKISSTLSLSLSLSLFLSLPFALLFLFLSFSPPLVSSLSLATYETMKTGAWGGASEKGHFVTVTFRMHLHE